MEVNKLKIIRRIIIVVFILILIIVSIIFKVNKNIEIQKNIEIEETPIIDNDIKLLENRNIFFTISTCIDKYTTYIANKDTKSLIDILDKGYINSHNITENSILDSLDKFDMTQINVVRKVFEREIDGYNSTYYVYYTSRDNLEAEMEDGFQEK